MLFGSLAGNLCLIALVALPASAEFTTFDSSTSPFDWYAQPLSNFTVITFDGMSPQVCGGSGSTGICYNLGIVGVELYGFQGSPAAVNSILQIVPENDSAQPWFDYGGTGLAPRLLRSDSATVGNQIGFRIVLPSPVTAFGVEVMSYNPANVSVNIAGTPISNALGKYPSGTLATTGIPNRSFFGVTSTTSFSYVDIISSPGSGNTIQIDNIAFGMASTDTAEPQTAVFLITGLGMMLLARRMKSPWLSSGDLS